MHTIIGSKIEIINPIKEIVNIAKERLVVRNPEYDNMIRMGKEDLSSFSKTPLKKTLTVFGKRRISQFCLVAPIMVVVTFRSTLQRCTRLYLTLTA